MTRKLKRTLLAILLFPIWGLIAIPFLIVRGIDYIVADSEEEYQALSNDTWKEWNAERQREKKGK